MSRHKNKNDIAYWIPDPPRRRATVQIDLKKILVLLCGLSPDIAHLISLWVKAHAAKGPGGKDVTDDEREEIQDALGNLLADIKQN